MKELSILFIGNSHTYFNDMPLLVKRRAEEEGYTCRVVMQAYPNWFLSQHAKDQSVRFNILYGEYDYVVLQEHAHPLGPEEEFLDAANELSNMIRQAGSTPVIFECWARKDEPGMQARMNEVYRHVAEKTGALLAPVGENWWKYKESRPDLEMYGEDGAHASPAGSDFVAKQIWKTIFDDTNTRGRSFCVDNNQPFMIEKSW